MTERIVVCEIVGSLSLAESVYHIRKLQLIIRLRHELVRLESFVQVALRDLQNGLVVAHLVDDGSSFDYVKIVI